jgi:hypothetical protein
MSSEACFKSQTIGADPREWPKKMAGGLVGRCFCSIWEMEAVVLSAVGKKVGRGRRMLTEAMSSTKMSRSGARMARFVTNHNNDSTEPMPWMITIGEESDGEFGDRYQYPKPSLK